MLYTTIVQRDETGLNMIYVGAKKFEIENALEAIIACKFNLRKVEKVLSLVRMYQNRLNISHGDRHLGMGACFFSHGDRHLGMMNVPQR